MKIFTVTLNGKDYEVRQDDDGVFSLPESLEYAVGVGTALKPAIEPIILARKPLDGTVASNVLAHGVGGLNIDACRVSTDDNTARPNGATAIWQEDGTAKAGIGGGSPAGRFPANVLLDEHAAKEMDKQSGVSVSQRSTRKKAGETVGNGVTLNNYHMNEDNVGGYSDNGGASRFFPVFKYQAKAPKRERPVIEREAIYGLRDDLTPEQVDHVRARLQEVGIEIE